MQAMAYFFRNNRCDKCGCEYDSTKEKCPACSNSNPKLRDADAFNNCIHLSWPRELIAFLSGWAGFQVLGLFISLIVVAVCKAYNIETSGNVTATLIVNGGAYVLLSGILLITVWPEVKSLLKTFKNWKSYAFGGAAFLVIIAFSIIYNVFISALFPDITSNKNQSTINSMIYSYPITSLIVFGFLGPICEEITYRVGLFTFLKRWHRVAAYVLAPIVFALIHFDWESIGTDTLANELLNIPEYLFAGLAFSYTYEKYGFGASSMAHISNNVYSVLATIINASK